MVLLVQYFEALARDVGLTVGVAVEVTVDGVTLQGYKRLVVSLNPSPNTNPPPPRVRVNNSWVSLLAGEGERCVDGVYDPDLGPCGGCGAACDYASDREDATAAGAAKRDEAREAVGAERSSDEISGHATCNSLTDEVRALQLLVNIFEVPL